MKDPDAITETFSLFKLPYKMSKISIDSFKHYVKAVETWISRD